MRGLDADLTVDWASPQHVQFHHTKLHPVQFYHQRAHEAAEEAEEARQHKGGGYQRLDHSPPPKPASVAKAEAAAAHANLESKALY